MARSCRFVLAVLALGVALIAQPAESVPKAQQQVPQTPQAQQPQNMDSRSGSASDLFSIDRIRRELERQPTINFSSADPNLPVFRLRVEGYRFQLPTWQQNFVLPSSPVPQPLGGSDFYEMQRLSTQPAAWGSSAFSNSDLLKMYGLSGAYGLAGALIKKGLEARASAEAARARAEVQQELADLAAHNARVAAGQAEDADSKQAAEKKKQEEAKKKNNKKKKDDGGR